MASPRARRAEIRKRGGKRIYAVDIYYKNAADVLKSDCIRVEADSISRARADAVALYNRPEKIDHIEAREG